MVQRPGLHRLAFHALTVVAILVCVVAARWQWDRANRSEADAVPQGPVVELADLDPATAFSGIRVQMSGRFDPEHEVLVAPRLRSDQPGAWVLTPLLPSSGEAAVAVVRGWVPAGQRPELPPPGEVQVIGVLVADARAPGAAVVAGQPPTLQVVDTGALAAHAGYPLRSGWYALTDLSPQVADQPLALQVSELPGADVGLNWRNAAYALQWIVFAGFAAFFWNRFRRDLMDRPLEQESPR
ncbi:MAG: SURF1 family protein [Candidatus Nanopelagicales bacterium]